jgi:hypothetical protein
LIVLHCSADPFAATDTFTHSITASKPHLAMIVCPRSDGMNKARRTVPI